MDPFRAIRPKRVNPRTTRYYLSTVLPVLLVSAIMIAKNGQKSYAAIDHIQASGQSPSPGSDAAVSPRCRGAPGRLPAC